MLKFINCEFKIIKVIMVQNNIYLLLVMKYFAAESVKIKNDVKIILKSLDFLN